MYIAETYIISMLQHAITVYVQNKAMSWAITSPDYYSTKEITS